ncbi:hypothetical protein NADE_001478 [Nannochloris sp. 'desiccata']|nr:hypothetical protein NADE_001478 [Chlorella desiccata (nom. nud.)]
MRCKESEAVGGAVMGSIIGTRHNTPLLRTTAVSTASVLILTGCFSAVQETTRRLRCQDSPLNSGIAGAATGALLFASHSAAPPRGAVICGALGAAAHWAVDQIALEKNCRSFLIAWGLLDDIPSTSNHHRLGNNGISSSSSSVNRGIEGIEEKEGLWARLRPYFPIRQLTDAEWEEHQKKAAAVEEKARTAALQGVSDAALDIVVDDNHKAK